tara:strand:- start:236 stop:484 length:249 start_codon:yes stop_codon:yes gene_type:complete
MSLTSPITPSDMKPAEIMYEMREIQDTWRQQNFFLSDAQKQRYADLLKMRRDRVQFFYDNDMVQKGPKVIKKPEPPQEDQDS